MPKHIRKTPDPGMCPITDDRGRLDYVRDLLDLQLHITTEVTNVLATIGTSRQIAITPLRNLVDRHAAK